MIVGTAGHIDHGKTTLVKALTGVDTDRLKEEKSRGISIELGYAYLPLPDGQILGFIDVPGHERLVHTMAAGAAGIDFGLLVVAADDGVMPQTREHLAILSMLGVRRGAVALTKTDRADDAAQAQARAQITALVRGTFLEGAPIFPVNAAGTLAIRDGAQAAGAGAGAAVRAEAEAEARADASGITALRDYLAQAAAALPPRRADGLFRLAVDRAFTLKGHGTVVTGTVYSGTVQAGDEDAGLRLFPSGRPVRVRSLHAQNRAAEAGLAGQRCALNLAGTPKESISRGDWIASADAFIPGRNVDTRLTMLPDDGAALRTWTAVHVHLGAAHHAAHAVPLSPDTLAAGETGWVQLVFSEPVCAMPGDRFIVRSAQADRTIAGGMVLDPNAPDRKRRAPQRLAWLAAVAAFQEDGKLAALLEHAPYGLDTLALMRLTGLPSGQITTPPSARWIMLRGNAPPLLILEKHWRALADRASEALLAFHERHPDEPGLDTGRLRRMALPALPEPHWLALRDAMFEAGSLCSSGTWLHHPGHSVSLSAAETDLALRLMPRALDGAFDPPWVRDHARDLDVPEDAVRQVLRKLMRRGDLCQVVKDLFYHRDNIETLAALVAQGGEQGISAAAFRDATGVGRKRAIQVLEFFDRAGYTRRVRDHHLPRADSALFWQRLS